MFCFLMVMIGKLIFVLFVGPPPFDVGSREGRLCRCGERERESERDAVLDLPSCSL